MFSFLFVNSAEIIWPQQKFAKIDGDLMIGGLHMIHEREENLTCGRVMPQGGIQAAEVMLYTIDKVNEMKVLPNDLKLGTLILDDCDRDTRGLQQTLNFIKGIAKTNEIKETS